MSTAQEILAAGGFQNADALVRAANDTGLPLGIAAALVAKESMGANVYGHDTGGALSGAGAVTQDNFTNQFLPLIRAGHTSNGVGPTQITYPGYFTQNPNLAWWDPYTNMVFGFQLMKGYLNGKYGDDALIAAGSAYNSGTATGALDYGRTFDQLATTWTARLEGSATTTSAAAAAPAQEEDIVASIDDLKTLLTTDVDVRRAIAVAIWGGGGAASPMYPVRGEDPARSEYPETALFSMKQRIGQMISASQAAIISQITAQVTSEVSKAVAAIPTGTVVTTDGSFSEAELVAAVQKAITGATITATENK